MATESIPLSPSPSLPLQIVERPVIQWQRKQLPQTSLTEIKPQDGPQTTFLASPADIGIYGGAAGGGKTWALLLEGLRNTNIPSYGATIFRRTYPQIVNQGGLWDESEKLFPFAGAVPTPSALKWEWTCAGGGYARIVFRHMQHEKDKEDYQGAQIPLVGFDELTHFTRTQFLYMLSRNRSTCGVIPYIRATCNPDPNSWVKAFLAPWLDKEFIQPNGERRMLASGEMAYFSGVGGKFTWHSFDEYKQELWHSSPEDRNIKSLVFVKASVFDNKILLRTNPQYLASLRALPLVEQERFLHGNWDVVETGNMFREEWFPIKFEHEIPIRFKRVIRFWDLASTKPSLVFKGKREDDPDYTAGVLLAEAYDETFWLLDVQIARDSPDGINSLMRKCARDDCDRWGNAEIWVEQEPGSNSEHLIYHLQTVALKGFRVHGLRATGSKIARAKTISAETQQLKVYMVSGRWNQQFLAMATAFPSENVHDDPVDALSGAFSAMHTPPEDEMYTPMFAVGTGWRDQYDPYKSLARVRGEVTHISGKF